MSWFYRIPSQNYKYTINGHQATKTDLLFNMRHYFQQKLHRDIPDDYLNTYSIIPATDEDRLYYQQLFQNYTSSSLKQFNLTQQQLRSMGCLLGSAIGDALGASTQFQNYDKYRQPWIKDSFKDLQDCINKRILYQRHGEVAIWTDDCSMALAMATSLVCNNYVFDPIHIRYMFAMWLRHGLGNGGRSHSIGLGGNISISMSEFMNVQKQFTDPGDGFNSGNGSLMRLAPIPITYRHDQSLAAKYSYMQSKTTHNGEEAAQCCRLMATLMVNLINRSNMQWRQVIQLTCKQFITQSKSVWYLSQSLQQTQQLYEQYKTKYGRKFTHVNHGIEDRNWNWKNKDHTYSPRRLHKQPHYIGSYCMDALTMALHIIWHKNSFKQCVLWAINMGGDCDTVGSIVGQLAGAIYGVNEEMMALYSEMQDFTKKRYEVFLLALKLTKRKIVQLDITQNNLIKNQNATGVNSANNNVVEEKDKTVKQEISESTMKQEKSEQTMKQEKSESTMKQEVNKSNEKNDK